MSVATASTVQIRLPEDLVREIDQVSEETGFQRVDLIRAAIRRFALSEQSWRNVQAHIEERAKAMGLHTEEDIEAFLAEDDNSEHAENQA
jgi:metal-responsive CopG/Arc/MetJ family transcriptional regulator